MKKIAFLLICLIVSVSSFAQIQKPSKWTFSAPSAKAKVGETINLVFTAKIDQGWYMYSSELKVEGPMPTEVVFVADNSFKPVGKLVAVNPKEKYDDVWNGKISYFVKEAKFIQKVKILKANPRIEGKINCYTCTEKSGTCVPSKDKFSFDVTTI